MDSNFYKIFMELLIKTYLSGYSNLVEHQHLKSTNVAIWNNLLDPYLNIKELMDEDAELNNLIQKLFYDERSLIEVQKFLQYFPFTLPHKNMSNAVIRIPKVFYCNKNIKHFNSMLSEFAPDLQRDVFNINLQIATMSNASEAIKMVKSLINGNLFFSEDELQKRIIHCNYAIKQRLLTIRTNVREKAALKE